jgi:hypothetical protein
MWTSFFAYWNFFGDLIPAVNFWLWLVCSSHTLADCTLWGRDLKFSLGGKVGGPCKSDLNELPLAENKYQLSSL